MQEKVQIVDLARDESNPSFEKLPRVSEICFFNAQPQKSSFRCALNCALKIREWILRGQESHAPSCDAESMEWL